MEPIMWRFGCRRCKRPKYIVKPFIGWDTCMLIVNIHDKISRFASGTNDYSIPYKLFVISY